MEQGDGFKGQTSVAQQIKNGREDQDGASRAYAPISASFAHLEAVDAVFEQRRVVPAGINPPSVYLGEMLDKVGARYPLAQGERLGPS